MGGTFARDPILREVEPLFEELALPAALLWTMLPLSSVPGGVRGERQGREA